MNKYDNPIFCSLPTAAELRESLRASESKEAREQISLLFDTDTFVEVKFFSEQKNLSSVISILVFLSIRSILLNGGEATAGVAVSRR